uniref:G_PROTEIN_RECEP_F1_2 domain-containing protein n=1 Tax=Syphacia muris TaxID=451379 RepID=A0A0N5AHL1_9BILA
MFAIKRVNLLETLLQMRVSPTMYLISRSQDILLIFLFLLTILVFVLTVIIIQRGRSFVDSFQLRDKQRKRRKFPFWKLSLGLVTYVILNMPYIVLSLKNLFTFDQCFWHLDRERKLVLVAAFRGFLLIRILLDAFVGYIIDSQIRKCTRSILLGTSISSMKSGDSVSNGPSFETSEKQRTVSRSTIIFSNKQTI